ncbi:MAG TPA: MarR family winged helix-turn-helix transcriptional regulator [Verrucomicrobiae bacterium]|nr:MarR family winged helix-turn-helix transcriptional regulator [Verrucomicrobiae bacterium]
MSPSDNAGRPCGAAFLLAQLGAHAAQRFGERIAALGLAPPHAGLLRMIASMPDCSQQKLAKRLGVLPSRMVMLIDDLEARGLVARRRKPRDRRAYSLGLTRAGTEALKKISRLAAEHEADLCAALTPQERATLVALCEKIAAQQGLTPGVHPSFKNL